MPVLGAPVRPLKQMIRQPREQSHRLFQPSHWGLWGLDFGLVVPPALKLKRPGYCRASLRDKRPVHFPEGERWAINTANRHGNCYFTLGFERLGRTVQ